MHPKMESLGELFRWLFPHAREEASDKRPKVALNERFLSDVLRTVSGNPFCTVEFVADHLEVNFESAYLALKELWHRGLTEDIRGEYIITKGGVA